MRLRGRVVALIVLGAILIGVALDKLWLGHAAPQFSKCLTLKPGITIFGQQFLPDLSIALLPVCCAVFVAFAVIMFPWHSLRKWQAWRGFFRRWVWSSLLFLLLPALALILNFVYNLSEPHLPKWASVVAKSFGFSLTSFCYGVTIMKEQPANIATLLGFFFGLFILAWYAREQ